MAYQEMRLTKEGAIALSKSWGKANDRGGSNPDKKPATATKKKPTTTKKGKK